MFVFCDGVYGFLSPFYFERGLEMALRLIGLDGPPACVMKGWGKK